jgi:hypothetical protein
MLLLDPPVLSLSLNSQTCVCDEWLVLELLWMGDMLPAGRKGGTWTPSKLGAKEARETALARNDRTTSDMQNLSLVIVITSFPTDNPKHDGSLECTLKVAQTTQSPYRV